MRNQALIAGCLTILLLALSSLTGCETTISDRDVRTATLENASRWAESDDRTLFVDARSRADFADGHIPGALNLDLRDLEDNGVRARLNGARRIVIYGQNPGSARPVALAKKLLKEGIKGGLVMEAGFDGWRDQGRPVVAN